MARAVDAMRLCLGFHCLPRIPSAGQTQHRLRSGSLQLQLSDVAPLFSQPREREATKSAIYTAEKKHFVYRKKNNTPSGQKGKSKDGTILTRAAGTLWVRHQGMIYFCGGLWAKLMPFSTLPLRAETPFSSRLFSLSVMLPRISIAFSAPLGYDMVS